MEDLKGFKVVPEESVSPEVGLNVVPEESLSPEVGLNVVLRGKICGCLLTQHHRTASPHLQQLG